MGAQCDGAFKILTPTSGAKTVAVVTGDPVFVAPPPVGTSDLCGYLKTAPRLLDVNAVVMQALDRQAEDGARLEAVGAACVGAVERFRKAYPEALQAYAGKEIFAVVVASYDATQSESAVGRFAVRMDADGSVATADVSEMKTGAESVSTVLIYGEADWAKRVVVAGTGRRFLDADAEGFFGARMQVSDVAMDRAIAVVRNLIEAAGRAAETDPPPSGIGGAVQVRVVGR
jgi:hypothetical protein